MLFINQPGVEPQKDKLITQAIEAVKEVFKKLSPAEQVLAALSYGDARLIKGVDEKLLDGYDGPELPKAADIGRYLSHIERGPKAPAYCTRQVRRRQAELRNKLQDELNNAWEMYREGHRS